MTHTALTSSDLPYLIDRVKATFVVEHGSGS